jgi:DNA-binding HxlR family transcriptional regulator
MGNRLAKTFNCPTEFTLQVFGGKWKTVIMCYLKVRPLRYAELRRFIPALSDKMLTQRLHELVEVGLVTRRRISQEKTDAYTLSARGQSLSTILVELYTWGDTHAESFGVKVGQPLRLIDRHSSGREAPGTKKIAAVGA